MVQFNSHATAQDLVSEVRLLCDADSVSYHINDITRRINAALEELVALILEADGEWQFDDTNHTTLPVGTINLTASQADYAFNEDFLAVEQVLIKDVSGNFQKLIPIDPKEFVDTPVEEYFATTGLPTHYDILGDTITLYPAPVAASVTLTAGLKVRFKRTVDLFTTTDTTQEPGLPSTHHIMLAYMAAVPYCMAYKKDRVALYEKKIDGMKPSLIEFYARRQKDKGRVFETNAINFK